jgi:hypothetical protein
VGVSESFWVTIAIELFRFYTISRTGSLVVMMSVLYPLDLGGERATVLGVLLVGEDLHEIWI